MDNEEDYLAHYGTKGMKWGVRKKQPSSGGSKRSAVKKKLTSISKQTISSFKQRRLDRKAKAAIKKEEQESESIKDISDQELRNRINRIKMENEYKQLTMSPKEKKRAETRKAIANYGAKAATEIVKSFGNMTVKLIETRQKETKEFLAEQKKKVDKEKEEKKVKELLKKYKDVPFKEFTETMKRANQIIDYDKYVS